MTNLNPFGKTSANSLIEEGTRILNVFTKTKEDLQKLNSKHEQYLDSVNLELYRLQAEKNMVITSMNSNDKIVMKIEEFLK